MMHKLVFKSNPWNNCCTDVPKLSKRAHTVLECSPSTGQLNISTENSMRKEVLLHTLDTGNIYELYCPMHCRSRILMRKLLFVLKLQFQKVIDLQITIWLFRRCGYLL